MFTIKSLAKYTLAATVALTAHAVFANSYPEHPIKIYVPYQAGGSTDIVIRKLAELAAPKLGQPVVIENKPGAGATLGAIEIKNAKPDGYTLAITPSPVFRMPHMQSTAYDPLTDFTYISMLSGYILGVAVNADSPYKTWEDLVQAARENPGKIDYGTASVGSASNVMMEQIAAALDIEWVHIPYKGESELLSNILGGMLDVYAGSSTVAPFVKDGTMRMLVTWGEEPSPLYPGTPTLNSIDPQFEPVYSPFGIAGPADMDPAVVEKLENTFKEILETEAFQEMLLQYGQQPVFMTSEEYGKYAKEKYDEEKIIVEQLNLAG